MIALPEPAHEFCPVLLLSDALIAAAGGRTSRAIELSHGFKDPSSII